MAPHLISPPKQIEQYADFCAEMVCRYALCPQASIGENGANARDGSLRCDVHADVPSTTTLPAKLVETG